MFVTFEGPEGGGKTTLIRSLAEKLESLGRGVVVTREPGAGSFGVEVRRLLLEGDDISPEAELFLFLADRSEHVSRVIRPSLDRGAVVLCDRFADSTVVYQGYGRGLDVELLRSMNRVATGGLMPSLTILLDLPVETGLSRATKGDRLDRAPLDFHQKVRQGFLAEAAADPDRWFIVDALQPAEQVFAEVWDKLAGL